jgi:hypothetical protein
MRYAVLVGINDYKDFVNLDYSYRDAEALARIFEHFCHIDSSAIKFVLSSEEKPNVATWATFQKIIADLKQVLLPGIDDLFFYFSGHGVAGKETTVVFGDQIHTVSEIMSEISQLQPKTKILIFDSCHSGAGILEQDKSAAHFSHASSITSGYCLLAAAAPDQKAKESRLLKHGRFTYFLTTTIADRQNYDRNACLDVNLLFSKVNTFFAENPDFKQTPAQQIKTIGSYPIATAINDDKFYVRYDFSDFDEFDWDLFLSALPTYLDTSPDMIGEFFRYVREHCLNTLAPEKGGAKTQSIELSKNQVILTDDGKFFDLFNPPEATVAGGGIKNAGYLMGDLKDNFEYSASTDGTHNNYYFQFKELSMAQKCQLNVSWRHMVGRAIPPIIIDEDCPHLEMKFDRYSMMISTLYSFIPACKKAAEHYQKIIYLDFPKGDRVINDVVEKINREDAGEWVKLRIY